MKKKSTTKTPVPTSTKAKDLINPVEAPASRNNDQVEDSVIFGTVSKDTPEQSNLQKAAINASLNLELETINESLLKISMLLNVSSLF